MWLRVSVVTVIATAATLVPSVAVGDPALETQVLQHANQFRAASGLAPLHLDGALSGSARSWSSHLAESGSLSHSSFTSTGSGSRRAENVGMGTSVSEVHATLVGSPAHAANLLDPRLTRVGIGVVVGEAGTVFVTQQFVGDGTAPTTATTTPTTTTVAPGPPAESDPGSPTPPAPEPSTASSETAGTPLETVPEIGAEPSDRLVLKLRLLRQLDG